MTALPLCYSLILFSYLAGSVICIKMIVSWVYLKAVDYCMEEIRQKCWQVKEERKERGE